MSQKGWIGNFLGQRGLAYPDSRALYAYKVTDRELSILRTYTKVMLLGRNDGNSYKYLDSIFCLYAAETFRREHTEGVWTWDTVFAPLEISRPDQSLLSRWVATGLAWWRRPLIRGKDGDRKYLATLACEGGLPLRLLQRESANLRQYFRAVLEGYHAQGKSGVEVAENIARLQSHRLPPTLRQEVVFHLGGDLVHSVSVLQQQVGETSDPIHVLDNQLPDWRSLLPLRLDESVAETLFSALLKRSTELAREAKSRLRWVTRLKEGSNEWTLEKELEIPERVRASQLKTWTGTSAVSPRLRLVLRKRANIEVVAWLTLAHGTGETAVYRREWLGRGGLKLSGQEATEPHLILLQDGHAEYPLSIQDGEPWGDMPWIFTRKESSQELIGIAQGSARTRNSEAWAVVGTALCYQATEGATCEQIGLLDSVSRAIYLIGGSVRFITPEQDGYQIDCGTDQDTNESFLLEGRTITETVNQRPLYIGLPRIMAIQADGKKEFATGQLQWRRIGEGGTWQDSSSVCMGRVWFRLIDTGGNERFRRQVDILPPSFRIDCSIGKDRQPGVYSLSGLNGAQVKLGHKSITIHGNPEQDSAQLECPPLSGSNLPILAVCLGWPGQGSIELHLPYPQHGAAFRLGGCSLRKNDPVPLSRLGGVEILLQNQVGTGRFWLDGELIASESSGGSGHLLKFRDRLPPLENGRRRVSLSPWVDRIGSLLAGDPQLEAQVRLEICSAHGDCVARITVSRFDVFLEPNRDVYQVRIPDDSLEKLGDGWETRVKLEMFPLWMPGTEPVELLVNPEHRACWSIPAGLQSGPWWIVGRDGDWARFRPLMWMVNPGDAPQTDGETDKELASAIREADAEQRNQRIDEALIALGENPDHPDWPDLMEFIRLGREFPPSSLDVLKRLVAYPQTLALALLKADDSLFDCTWSLAEQMPFSWSMVPVKTWLNVARLHVECLHDALGELDADGEMTFGLFQGFRERATARRAYWKPLGDWLQEQLFPDRPMPGGELHLARSMRTLVEEQVSVAEAELQGRHDSDEQWPQSCEAERIISREKFPPEYRFTRLETHYRPVRFAPFVVAHVALRGIPPNDALIYESRLIRAFDAEWFDKAYAIALTLGLAELTLESMT